MGIIVSSSEGPDKPFTFTHELVRQTLLAGISAPRRQQLHAAVAEAIERLNPDAVDERAGEIADNLIKAGSFVDRQMLVRWLTLAGKSALGAAAFEEARRNFQSALSHQSAVDPRQRADLLANLARVERGLDHWDVALAHLHEVVEIYVNLGDREMVGGSFAKLTGALNSAGRFKEAIETAHRGLAYLQADISAGRVRLLAGLAQALATTRAYEPAHEALRKGLNIASQLSDPKLEARLLGVQSVVDFQFLQLRESASNGFLGKQLGGSDLPLWDRGLQLLCLYLALVYVGRLEEATRIADELEPLAIKIRQYLSVAFCLSTRAWIEFGKTPDLDKLEASFQRVSKSAEEAPFAYSASFSEVQLSLVNFFRGNWADAILHAQASCRAESGSSIEGSGQGTLFRQMAYAGSRDRALAILYEKRALLPRSGQPNSFGSWSMLALVIEGLVMLGERSQAAQLYSLARELVDTGAVTLSGISRFTQTIAGLAAAAAHQWEAAETHFQIALQQAESFPYRLEQAEIRRFHAMMLIDRAAPGDRVKAQTLLREALESYQRIGMPRHVDLTQNLLARAAEM